jgi:Ala-tRNA(Pro) deacylase
MPATETIPLIALLQERGIEFELLPHPRTLSAAGEARALGVPPERVAKTLLARDDGDRCIRAVIPASTRLDLTKLAHAVAAAKTTLLTEEELVAVYPQFELGAVPPFGGPAGDRIVVDRGLAETEYVVFEGGVHDESLRMRLADLIGIADAELADIAVAKEES